MAESVSVSGNVFETSAKTKEKKLIVWGAIIGAFLVAAIVGLICWFFITMPKMEKDLKYSPFMQEGTWQCRDMDFTITSSKHYLEDDPMMVDSQEYTIDFGYVSTRGFGHKYAVQLYFADIDGVYKISSCLYKFEENSFVLKDFNYKEGSKTLPAASLTFDKIG